MWLVQAFWSCLQRHVRCFVWGRKAGHQQCLPHGPHGQCFLNSLTAPALRPCHAACRSDCCQTAGSLTDCTGGVCVSCRTQGASCAFSCVAGMGFEAAGEERRVIVAWLTYRTATVLSRMQERVLRDLCTRHQGHLHRDARLTALSLKWGWACCSRAACQATAASTPSTLLTESRMPLSAAPLPVQFSVLPERPSRGYPWMRRIQGVHVEEIPSGPFAQALAHSRHRPGATAPRFCSYLPLRPLGAHFSLPCSDACTKSLAVCSIRFFIMQRLILRVNGLPLLRVCEEQSRTAARGCGAAYAFEMYSGDHKVCFRHGSRCARSFLDAESNQHALTSATHASTSGLPAGQLVCLTKEVLWESH